MKIKARAYVHDRLFDESEHRSLTAGRIYDVVGLDSRSYRAIDDRGEPILFHKGLFDVVDSSIPDDWVTRKFDDDEYYIDPPELAGRGFYEDYFDGVEAAVKTFEEFRKRNSLASKPG